MPKTSPHYIPVGERLSDWITAVVGSWQFVILQLFLLIIWIVMNVVAWVNAWDPYPFIFLNLILSFESAFTAPIILMSQNRQNTLDRTRAENDYEINAKAAMEIALLHQKIDRMKEEEIKELLRLVKRGK